MAERDERGRFKKGHTPYIGGGRPRREVEQRLFQLMSARLSDTDWHAIIDKQIEVAKAGSTFAASWVADRLMGKSVERQEVDAVVTASSIAEELRRVAKWKKNQTSGDSLDTRQVQNND